MKKTILIIGAGGFIGVNVALELAAAGHSLVLVDRALPPQAVRIALGDRPWVLGDVRDEAFLQSVITTDIDCIVWGAALTADATRDALEPDAILDVNLVGLARTLKLARARRVSQVINLGSVASFGEAAFAGTALHEDDLTDPRGLYALSKFAGERLCMRFADLTGQSIFTLRLSAAFGPWERMTGARDTPSPFMQLMALAERGEPARLQRPCFRDWVYAPDVAAAVALLINRPPSTPHRLFHVSSGARFSVLDWGLALAARRTGWQCGLAGSEGLVNVDPQGQRDRADMSIARLAEAASFQPRFGLAESVAHLDAWARAHPGWFVSQTGTPS
ncbi:MAG: NAD(P)-dependent oxidoreductase [Betaproteobacteria bacterium]|nr:NAD(P)-dependent oxidoreductase [Betaproteobacteria bacterium]